ncbi:hypothetical protein [Massilia sp. CCM 8734]|uniref:hypothetical protein n=1 Tax=Massilia sp. CCM 8734 TaxID=2609283 RepID=UPI001423AAC2|nr:hypothetical protein [Massilia sp. CCM 8734]NHZ96566.1 hypothetical protein [Massilia sp. CCM 8734]
MSFSDEILKAYADGALGEDTRQAVEAALREDPLLAARVRLLLTQHSNAFAGFGPGSADGAAQRQPQAPRSAKVVHLHAVRNARVAGTPAPVAEETPQIWSWPAWAKLGGMLSAALLAGAGLGYAIQPVPLVLGDGDGAALMARGALALALTQQLSGAPAADAPVRIERSYLSKEGAYCRSFRVANGGGLACRIDGGGWQIDLFASMDGAPGEYRSPGDGMPQALASAIARRADEPLDPLAERAARDRSWKR